MRLTKPQLEALKTKWMQSQLKTYLQANTHERGCYTHAESRYKSFLSFRRAVQGTYGLDDAVTVQWCGMWLCIEKDGYCHT